MMGRVWTWLWAWLMLPVHLAARWDILWRTLDRMTIEVATLREEVRRATGGAPSAPTPKACDCGHVSITGMEDARNGQRLCPDCWHEWHTGWRTARRQTG